MSEDGTFTMCHDQASVHTSECVWCARLAPDTGVLGSEFPFARQKDDDIGRQNRAKGKFNKESAQPTRKE